MREQKLQISLVRKFVEKNLDEEHNKEKIKHSLIMLYMMLAKQEMSLEEVVEQLMIDLNTRANQRNVSSEMRLDYHARQSREETIQ